MGSARVQYELERTLPSLQLAATHGLFSKDVELRGITQRRRQLENALVRRHALASDYLQYIRYEEDLERLRVLRVTRFKDLNKIPGQDMIKMQKEAINHIVSIFERAVKRLRYDVGLWEYYIRWAHKRKMRTVVSRVSARALALFPNKVDLWLLVADHELNDYQGASTSRALLQRGLRLNSISHPWSIKMQAQDRPKKKVRKAVDLDEPRLSKSLLISPSGNKEDDEATLVLTDAEQDLIRIWIQYARMELVFIERLRRRRIVLGILEDSDLAADEQGEEPDEDAGADQVPINNDGETAPPSLKSMKQDDGIQQPSDALLQGAIPKAALRSAISLQSPSSLPPRAHFALLVALADLVRNFPFCEDKGELRSGLLREIDDAIRARFPADGSAMLLLSASSVLDRSMQSSLAAMSELEIKEELQDGRLLRLASALASSPSNKSVERIFEEAHIIARGSVKEGDSDAYLYVLHMLKEVFNKVRQTTQIASDTRTIIESMRNTTLQLTSPNGGHLASQLRLIRFFQEVVESKDLGEALHQYLKACHKRVVQDAKKLQCDGLDLEREQCRGRLREVSINSKGKETKARGVKIAETMWKSCERYPQDELLLQLYAEAIVANLNCGALSQEDGLELWQRVQSHGIGKMSPRVWQIWLDWVMAHEDHQWILVQLETSLPRTMGSLAAHEVLLKGYLCVACKSSQELIDRIAYVEKKAYPQPSFWRWAIAETRDWSISDGERTILVKRLHTKLIQTVNNDVEDYITYLRFLVLEVDEPALGLEVFIDAQSRLSNITSRKVALEEAWQDICQSLRLRQEQDQQEQQQQTDSEQNSEEDEAI